MKKKKSTGKTVGIVIIALLCIGLVVGSYYYLSTRKIVSEEELTEVEKVILKDLSGKAYPATPREVVKFYNRILCCYYNEEYTDEQFYQLADQARLLMDKELADNNQAEQYYLRTKADIDAYHQKKKTISNTSVCSTNDVKYAEYNEEEYAYVEASYFIKEDGGFKKSLQNYVLRKSKDGKWGILAFELKEGDTSANE